MKTVLAASMLCAYAMTLLGWANDAPVAVQNWDLLIKNGTLIDGTGVPGREVDIAIQGDRIVFIGKLEPAKFKPRRTIDATGKVITPGFIDTHCHGDPLQTPEFDNFLAMGVTTLCLGQDGESPRDLASWMQQVTAARPGPNIATFVGHGTIRHLAGVGLQRNPSSQQVEAMQALVCQAMAQGCLGLTTGLEYQPGMFADIDELIALAKPVAEAGGLVMSHMRSEDDDQIERALGELIQQGQGSGCPVHISHLKVGYGHGARRAEQILAVMNSARDGGLRVTANGQIVRANGQPTGIRAGRILKRQGESLAMQVDTLFTEYDRPDVPGASVAVVRDGEILIAKGYGLADPVRNLPAGPRTNYRLASVSKQFTAMGILLLHDRGLLQYDDPITRFFPDFPEIGHRITVRHLLGHTSGLVDYEAILPPGQTEQLKDRDVLAIVQSQHGTYFTPGTEFRYSNTGYALLALIVEAVSGTDYATFLHENIFQPLGMTETVAYEKGISTVSNRAFGCKKTDQGFIESDQSVTSAVLGDGGIYTSIADYLKWEHALRGTQWIRQELLDEAFRPGRLPDGTSTGYGFGWRVRSIGADRLIYHDGDTCGFSTAVRRIPEKGLAIVVLISRADDAAPAIADRILAWLLERPAADLSE